MASAQMALAVGGGAIALAVIVVLVIVLVRSRKARSREPAPQAREKSPSNISTLRRVVPWIELILGGSVALFLYFVLGQHELAEFFALASALLALGRLSYTAESEKAVRDISEPLERIREHFDVSAQAHFPVFRDMLQVYSKITEPEFVRVKDGILADARSRLLDLANDKKSVVLPTTTYYGWLLPMLEKAMPPERIWALSMMREPEWDDSQPERNFIQFSKEASERGVPINRVFVMGKGVMPGTTDNPAIKLHLHKEKPVNLLGFAVDEDVVKRSDHELYSKLGDGFIAFGDRVALVDVFSGNSARGYVTMSPVEIARLRDVYDRLRILAEPLDSYLSRRGASHSVAPRTDDHASPAALALGSVAGSRPIDAVAPAAPPQDRPPAQRTES